MSPPTPSTPESVRQKVAEALAAQNDAATEDEEEDDSGEGEEEEGENQDGGVVAANPHSSIFDQSTIFVGPFAMVKRTVSGIDSYYVTCPLHSYKGADGAIRRCSKSMQVNQPDLATVVARLRWWVYQGSLDRCWLSSVHVSAGDWCWQ